ncbi:MAG: methyltransferase [Pseudomonadota bacterium]
MSGEGRSGPTSGPDPTASNPAASDPAVSDRTVSDLSHDAFLGGRLWLWQPAKGYRAATDPVLLAACVPARDGQSVLDLGCGVGAAALCLARRVAGLRLHGLEVQTAYAALARRNAAEAAIALTVHDGDLKAPPAALRHIAFDHVLANPPFFGAAQHTSAADPGRDAAHRDGDTPLERWIDAGLKRLKSGGMLTMIQRSERLPAMLGALAGRAGNTTLLPLSARAGRPAQRLILQTQKGAKGPFRLLAPLILHSGAEHLRDAEDYTPQLQRVLRDGASLTLV